MNYPVFRYTCRLIREPVSETLLPDNLDIQSIADAVDAIKLLTSLDKAPCEQLWAIHLNCRLQVTGYALVAQGGITGATFEMGNVFREAILANAKAMILAHNHPSGEATPSSDDIKYTEEAVKAGKVLGIEVLDHIIIGLDRDAFSMLHSEYVEF